MAASPYPSPNKFPVFPTSLSRSFYVRHRYNFRAHIDVRHRGNADLSVIVFQTGILMAYRQLGRGSPPLRAAQIKIDNQHMNPG
jgi:hypothetical protein